MSININLAGALLKELQLGTGQLVLQSDGRVYDEKGRLVLQDPRDTASKDRFLKGVMSYIHSVEIWEGRLRVCL